MNTTHFPRGTVSLTDKAQGRIRQMIRAGQITSQTVLRETDLARELDMSRTPVREALLCLRAEGVVNATHRGGYLLIEVDEKVLRDVYEVREALESVAARLATQHASRTDIARLEDLFEGMDDALARGDAEGLSLLNGQFHDAIAGASNNAYLQSSMANIRDVVARYRPAAMAEFQLRSEAHDSHRGLLNAIIARNGAGAAAAAAEHVRRALITRLGQKERSVSSPGHSRDATTQAEQP